MNVYPNPVHHDLFLEGEDIEHADVTLTNSLGQKVFVKATVESNKVTLHMADLASGVYIIVIRNHGKTRTEKIVVE
jgi:Secretion system C-terminal sorting domain